MKLYTEKEHQNQRQHFAFRLRNLYNKNYKEFVNLQDYLPFSIYINERKTLKYHFFNECFIGQGKEIENLMTIGREYLDKISNPILLKQSVAKAKLFDVNNDYDGVSSYLQAILLNNKMTAFFTSKILINNTLTLNTPFFPSENIIYEKVFKEIIPYGEENLNNWLRFQNLTKREKEILKLIATENCNKTIGDMLFISQHTVKTHRKNIYKKLNIQKTSQLVRFAIALELLH